ncbi:MAG: alanyl-tRNA editing protein [Spirochaetaceae bacterium]|nr:MAG: alanyl-tRNA editing protein [Spirochaetaceae bacterium]
MSATTPLYYDEPELYEFKAIILELREHPGTRGCEVVLDRSAFYPEGGGQPADRGDIAGLPVTQVSKDNGVILHRVSSPCEELPDSFVVGAEVACTVDEAWRRDYKQQHTGQHIISAALLEVADAATVSVHQGAEYLTVEVESEAISEAQLEAVERRANEVIEADLPVKTVWVTDADIESYPLRRKPKVSGSIRLVMVGAFDCVACGGVHVSRSAEVRLVHCIGVERIRGRVRSIWKTGDRALADYRLKCGLVRELVDTFSAPAPDLAAKIRAKLDEHNEVARRMGLLERRLAEESAVRLLSTRAKPHAGAGQDGAADIGANDSKAGVLTAVFENESKGFLRQVGERLAAESGIAACLVNRKDDSVEWCIAVSPDREFEFNAFRPELLRIVDGKGGGKSPVWQGGGSEADCAEALFGAFSKHMG